MARKYYAVAKGFRTGIFRDWFGEAKPLVDGYKGAVYKGFTTLAEAEKFLKNPTYSNTSRRRHFAKPKKKHGKSPKRRVTNPLGLTSFYNGELPPWESETFIACIACFEGLLQDLIDSYDFSEKLTG